MWEKKRHQNARSFRARCPECGAMHYATPTLARALKQSEQDGSIVLYDCGHSTGYTYAQLSKRSSIYVLLARDAE